MIEINDNTIYRGYKLGSLVEYRESMDLVIEELVTYLHIFGCQKDNLSDSEWVKVATQRLSILHSLAIVSFSEEKIERLMK